MLAFFNQPDCVPGCDQQRPGALGHGYGLNHRIVKIMEEIFLDNTTSPFVLQWDLGCAGLRASPDGASGSSAHMVGTASFTPLPKRRGRPRRPVVGAGYGYVGASLTSLIYATNFIMYFGLEGSIMAAAIHAYFQVIPLWLIMIVVGIGIIPLNWYGIRQLDAFQKWSIPIYIILLIGGIGASMTMHLPHSTDWISYLPAGAAIGGGGLLACLGMMNGSVGIQALLVSDYGRFIRKDEFKIGSFFVGFGSQFVCFFVAGLIGIWFGVRYNEVNPGVFFVSAIGVWGALFAILTQLRINVTNMYSGSLSLSNFFEHIFHFVPGRVFWVATTAIVATVAMLFGILNYLGPLLTWQGVFLFAWLASLLADIIVVKGWLKIGTSAAMIEYRPSHLRGWNPVGVVSLIISCAIGTLMVFGVMGSFWASTAAFASAVIELILYLLFSVIANGRFDSVKPLPKEEVLES